MARIAEVHELLIWSSLIGAVVLIGRLQRAAAERAGAAYTVLRQRPRLRLALLRGRSSTRRAGRHLVVAGVVLQGDGSVVAAARSARPPLRKSGHIGGPATPCRALRALTAAPTPAEPADPHVPEHGSAGAQLHAMLGLDVASAPDIRAAQPDVWGSRCCT
jgi:hypothetical protein